MGARATGTLRSPCPFEHWNGAPLKCNPQHGNQVGERLLPRVARSPPTTYPYPAVSRPSVQYSTVAARPPKASGRGRRLTPSAGRPEHSEVKFPSLEDSPQPHTFGDHQHVRSRSCGLLRRPAGRTPLSGSAARAPPALLTPLQPPRLCRQEERRNANSWTQRLLVHLERGLPCEDEGVGTSGLVRGPRRLPCLGLHRHHTLVQPRRKQILVF